MSYEELYTQKTMLKDKRRNMAYYKALHDNPSDIVDKVVLDVGTGTGILAIMAVKAGAKKVYAVEISDMHKCANELIKGNNVSDKIKLINGNIREIELPEKVDVIISEWMGTILINEGMLDDIVYARNKFLKEGGKIFPTQCNICIALLGKNTYTDDYTKFWDQQDYFGVDFSSLKQHTIDNFVDTEHMINYKVDPKHIASNVYKYGIDLTTVSEEDLKQINVKFELIANQDVDASGLSCWFDAIFNGTNKKIKFSTSPFKPLTHWGQSIWSFKNEIKVKRNDKINVEIKFEHIDYGYKVNFSVKSGKSEESNTLDSPQHTWGYDGSWFNHY